MSQLKVKTPAKKVLTRTPQLEKTILDTMREISDAVGVTLGPGGCPMLLERPEFGLPASVTKDGITVFRSLGYDDPAKHCIMEAARDAATRTASEAGDGPQPLYAQILTPSGFIKMGDIKLGMEICGTNGSLQKVVGVFPKGKKEIIKITFEQGQVVECCEDHLWSVTSRYRGAKKTLTTKEMMFDYKKAIKGTSHHTYKYFTPRTQVNFGSSKKLPLDPYLLGVLIGDGCLRDSGSVELSMGKAKKHIFRKLKFPKGISINTVFVEEKNSFRAKITGKDKNGKTIRDLLAEIGLKNADSYTKFIPKLYLLSSVVERSLLLQGLIDTDGHKDKKRGLFEFSTVCDELASDFRFLCRSLGKSVYYTLHEKAPNDGSYSDTPMHRFSELKGRKHGLKIKNMERTGEFTEMQCIKVSNSDNLYITDNFVVTHNTTTATVLAESIVRRIYAYCKANPRVSPQKIVRRLEFIFKETIEPTIRSLSRKVDFSTEEGKSTLTSVAKISANGDEDLAKAVMECFEITGDHGNVTITEQSGPSSYEVESVDGYPIGIGYEESCAKFFQKFLNDPGSQRVFLEKPIFIVYHGIINTVQTLLPLMQQIGSNWSLFNAGEVDEDRHNVVIVAAGYSESVLGTLAANFAMPDTINVFPLVAPKSPQINGQLYFFQDICAIAAAKLFDPINNPLESAKLEDLGPGLDSFECQRFRSTILGFANETLLVDQIAEVEQLLANPESELDKILLEERMAKLSGGIARLRVVGASAGELKEKRDRAEDAVCAVRGAIKHGCLPGGAWALLKLTQLLPEIYENDDVVLSILGPSFLEPFIRIMSNCGLKGQEIGEVLAPIIEGIGLGFHTVYDASEHKHCDAFAEGILDSTPAVLEAVRNSLSIASLLGTLGGLVVYKRDAELERQEGLDTAEYLRNAGVNERNERG